MNKLSLRKLALIACALVLSAACVVIMVSSEAAVTASTLNYAQKEQERSVRLAAESIGRDMSAEALDALYDGVSYWFIYAGDTVVFERNAATTAGLRGMGLGEVAEHYSRLGGEKMTELYAAFAGAEGAISVAAVKDKAAGTEMISALAVTVDGERYILGRSTLQSYIFASANIGGYLLRGRIAVIILAVLLPAAVFAGILLISAREKKINALEAELVVRNKAFHQAPQTQSQCGQTAADSVYDEATGAYSSSFLDAFIEKLGQKKLRSQAVIISTHDYYANYYQYNKQIAEEKLATLVHWIIDEVGLNGICARLEGGCFAVILTGEGVDFGIAERLKSRLQNENLTIHIGEISSEIKAAMSEALIKVFGNY